jgi:hypothetical protein
MDLQPVGALQVRAHLLALVLVDPHPSTLPAAIRLAQPENRTLRAPGSR